MTKHTRQTVREYLNNPEQATCNNFFDWFCKDSLLPNKQRTLDKKVRRLVASTKLNMDAMYVTYKNNRSMSWSLYDDIRFCDMKSGVVVYTVIPRSGHKIHDSRAEVWGAENGFDAPLVTGAWKDVLRFFNVQ